MKVKISETDEIRCSEDAFAKVRKWLDKHGAQQIGEAPGTPVVLRSAGCKRESDGWYAIFEPSSIKLA